MTDRETELLGWLNQAYALLAIEARDHEDNRQWDSVKQRHDVAKILRDFLTKAAKVIDKFEKAGATDA